MPTQRGAEPESFCEQCGARLVAGSRFCEACGLAVGSPPSGASAAVAPDVVVVSANSPPRPPSSRFAGVLLVAAVVLVLASLGGWWLWSRSRVPDVAPPRAMATASTATPTAVDSLDAQYRAARARYDVAYKEYTRLMSTGGEGNVEVALQEYRKTYAEVMRIDSLRKGLGKIR